MEKLRIATLSCRESNLKYEAIYNPQWQPYISEQDFQTVLKQLNIAAEKGPNQGVMVLFYLLMFLGFIGFIVGGFSMSGGPPNIGVVFIPFVGLIIVSICATAYRKSALATVDKELRSTASKLSAALGQKKILVEYDRDLYAIRVRVNNNTASTENKYDYNIHIYYLREATVQQPQVVLDINSILPILQQMQQQPAATNLSDQNQNAMANMSPEMQAQFAAFLAQQNQAPPPYRSG
ncbi:hypothetical protein HDV06_005457 [Boothiomyces sp. JEL0866]|nr:hypothetical protein HDV06_005457 [Boothiomyces sp. JEL0866]